MHFQLLLLSPKRGAETVHSVEGQTLACMAARGIAVSVSTVNLQQGRPMQMGL